MNSIYFLSAIVAVTVAAPQQPTDSGTTPIPIIKYENEGVNFDGSYKFLYETGNDIVAEESGFLKNPNTENEAQSVVGSYSYTAPDGTRISVTYTAGEEGFVPVGDHLPTPPPIPAAIQRALDYILANPSPEDAQAGAGDSQASAPQPQYQRPKY